MRVTCQHAEARGYRGFGLRVARSRPCPPASRMERTSDGSEGSRPS